MIVKAKEKVNKGVNSTLLIGILMAAGVVILLYPVLSNLYNKATGSYAIQEFNRQIASSVIPSFLRMR